MLDSLNLSRFRIFIVLLLMLLLGLANFTSAWPVSAQTPPASGTPVGLEQDSSRDEAMRIKNLTLSGDAPGTLTISWDAPETYTITYMLYWEDRIGYGPSSKGHTGHFYRFSDETSYTVTGLAHGEVYNIRLKAVFDSGTIQGPFSYSSGRSGGSQGRVVSGLKLTDVDYLKAEVGWNQPSEAPISYQLLSPNKSSRWRLPPNPGTFETNGPHMLWIYGEGYTYRVRARYSDGYGPWSEGFYFEKKGPRHYFTVKGLRVSSVEPGTITVRWNKSEKEVRGYTIWFKRLGGPSNPHYTPRIYTRINQPAESTSFTWTGLIGGSIYRVYMHADFVNVSHTYKYKTAPVFITVASSPPPSPAPAPAPPRTPVPAPPSTPEPTPTSTPEPTPTSTPVSERSPGRIENLRAAVSVRISDDNPQTESGLKRFLSRSESGGIGGISRASGADGVRKEADRSVINHDNTVVLSWDAPSSGPTPDGYRIYRSKYTVSSVTQNDVLSEDTGSTTTTFTDRTPESLTFYGYFVSALIGDVEGETSNEIRLTTNPVANTPTSPLNLSATQSEQGNVVLKWEKPAYTPVEPCKYDVFRSRHANASDLTALTWSDTQADHDTYYRYGVWATCGGYKGSHAIYTIRTNTSAAGVPHKPIPFFTEYDDTNNGISLKWIVFDDDTVTAFVISRTARSKVPALEETHTDLALEVSPSDLESPSVHTDTKVIEGSTYRYEIKSRNAQNTLSDPLRFSVVAKRVTGRPLGVTNLRVTNNSVGSIRLQWNAPDQSGSNPAVTGYKIHRKYMLDDPPTVVSSNVDATATSYSDTASDLKASSKYYYYVTAFNAAGHSQIAETEFYTDVVLPTDPSLAPPLFIENLRETDRRIGRIRLEWNAQRQGAPSISGFTVLRQDLKTDALVTLVDGSEEDETVQARLDQLATTATSYTDDSQDLVAERRYLYSVGTYNANGTNLSNVVVDTLPSDAASPDGGSSDDGGPEPEAPVLGDPQRPPRPGTSATATMDTSGTPVNLVVSWVDGTAGTRVCHADYKVNIFDPDRALLPSAPAQIDSDSPIILIAHNPHENIDINNVQMVLGVVSPHLRTIAIPVETEIAPNSRKVRVWCGEPTTADSVLIGETPLPAYTLPDEEE